VPGIGKKTAERLLLELKGKLGADLGPGSAAAPVSDAQSDIVQALMALGYTERDTRWRSRPCLPTWGSAKASSWP
jgi:Holliday junction DNA helicase RuvA